MWSKPDPKKIEEFLREHADQFYRDDGIDLHAPVVLDRVAFESLHLLGPLEENQFWIGTRSEDLKTITWHAVSA